MNEQISPSQMAGLLLAFTIGSSIMFIPSPVIHAAGHGAWLSILMAGGAGGLQLMCIMYLRRRFPLASLHRIYARIFSRFGAALLTGWLIFVLVLMVANITLGMSQFFVITMMADTPPYMLQLLVLIAAGFTARAGIEVSARLFALFLFFLLCMIAVILLTNIPIAHPELLLPQWREGWKPLLHGAYIAHGFPYAELFVLAVLLHHVKRSQTEPLSRYLFYMLIVNMLILILIIVFSFMVFGDLASSRKYPLYEMARLIEIQGVMERIESIAGIVLITSSYIKSTIALIALGESVSQLLKLPEQRRIIMPLTLLIFFVTLTMFHTEIEASQFWSVIWPLLTASAALPLIAGALIQAAKEVGRKLIERSE